MEKRRRVIINLIYAGIILGLIYLLLKYAFWMLLPFIAAFVIAAILQRPVNFLASKTPLKKGLLSGIMVLLIAAILVTILVFTGARIASEAQGLVRWVGMRLQSLPQIVDAIHEKLVALAARLPEGLKTSAQEGIDGFFQRLNGSAEAAAEEAVQKTSAASLLGGIFSKLDLSMLSKPVSGVWNTAKQIPSVLVGVLISIIAACFMTAGYDEIVNFIKRQMSVEKRHALTASKEIFFSSILKMLKSYALIICITFAEMFVGLMVLKLLGAYTGEYVATVAIVVALIDIFPVLGTGTVLIPWSIISFITGHVGMGIGLLVLYAVITVIRQIIEPKLVAANLGLPPIVTLMCMYIGLQLFGVPGIFIMPLLVTMVKLLNDRGIIHVWKTKAQEPLPETTEPSPEEPAES
ncbi:MAG: sporulation integral membrane protein YtvI [Clostridia bacterium]|nr:sporulation integral membrane protein YtvI [Clostridia bacterium]